LRKFFINGRFLTQSITGVQRYAHELTRAFDSLLDEGADFAAEILCPPLPAAPPSYRNIPVRIVGARGGHLWEQTTLPAAVGDGTLFCPGNTAPLRSLFGKARVVVCVHDLSYLYFPDAYSAAYRAAYNVLTPLIFRRADAVITVSNAERAAIVARYPHVEPRIGAIQNGGLNASVRLDGERAGDMPEPGYMLYVGSLSKRKNFPMTFDVACRLAASRGLRTVFVGGTAASLEATDQRVPDAVADRILFAGQVNDTGRLVDYYRGDAS
jgi:glycosyltransferase involved in cell wall biosynthesis